MRALIVHNLKSGFGSDAIFEFERALVKKGDEIVLRILPEVGGADEALKDAEDFDLVVASGGDGTVANIFYRLANRGVKSCIFPSGTANLFFQTLGNSTEPYAIAHSCREGKTILADMGKIEWTDADKKHQEHGFSIMAGTGFDAQIMAAAVPHKQTLGEAAYFTAVLSNTRPEVHKFEIEVDGKRMVKKGIAAIVANNAMIQGDIEIVPNSSISDGLLDLIILEVPDAYHLIRPMIASIIDKTGKDLGRPNIFHLQGKDITVRSSKPMPMQVDGEVIEGSVTSYHASVIPHANEIIVDRTSRYYK